MTEKREQHRKEIAFALDRLTRARTQLWKILTISKSDNACIFTDYFVRERLHDASNSSEAIAHYPLPQCFGLEAVLLSIGYLNQVITKEIGVEYFDQGWPNYSEHYVMNIFKEAPDQAPLREWIKLATEAFLNQFCKEPDIFSFNQKEGVQKAPNAFPYHPSENKEGPFGVTNFDCDSWFLTTLADIFDYREEMELADAESREHILKIIDNLVINFITSYSSDWERNITLDWYFSAQVMSTLLKDFEKLGGRLRRDQVGTAKTNFANTLSNRQLSRLSNRSVFAAYDVLRETLGPRVMAMPVLELTKNRIDNDLRAKLENVRKYLIGDLVYWFVDNRDEGSNYFNLQFDENAPKSKVNLKKGNAFDMIQMAGVLAAAYSADVITEKDVESRNYDELPYALKDKLPNDLKNVIIPSEEGECRVRIFPLVHLFFRYAYQNLKPLFEDFSSWIHQAEGLFMVESNPSLLGREVKFEKTEHAYPIALPAFLRALVHFSNKLYDKNRSELYRVEAQLKECEEWTNHLVTFLLSDALRPAAGKDANTKDLWSFGRNREFELSYTAHAIDALSLYIGYNLIKHQREWKEWKHDNRQYLITAEEKKLYERFKKFREEFQELTRQILDSSHTQALLEPATANSGENIEVLQEVGKLSAEVEMLRERIDIIHAQLEFFPTLFELTASVTLKEFYDTDIKGNTMQLIWNQFNTESSAKELRQRCNEKSSMLKPALTRSLDFEEKLKDWLKLSENQDVKRGGNST